MGPSFKMLDIHLHPLPSAAVYAALSRSHAVLAFMDVGVEFVNIAAGVGAVGFLRIYRFYISASLSPLRPSDFDSLTCHQIVLHTYFCTTAQLLVLNYFLPFLIFVDGLFL